MKSTIDKYIPLAVKAIQEKIAEKPAHLKVEKAYTGCVASFGTGLHHSGVLATVAMFSDSKGDVDKSKLLDAVFDVLKKQRTGITEGNLFDYLLTKENELPRLKKELTDISIALKLALRTFDLS